MLGIGSEGGDVVTLEAEVLRVHAHRTILREDRHDRIDPERWRPLHYAFRHYFAQCDPVGSNFRAPLLNDSAAV